MDTAADRRRRTPPAEPALPARELTLPPPVEVTMEPADEASPPPDLKIHRRRPLPEVPTGPAVPDRTPSPPIEIDER